MADCVRWLAIWDVKSEQNVANCNFLKLVETITTEERPSHSSAGTGTSFRTPQVSRSRKTIRLAERHLLAR